MKYILKGYGKVSKSLTLPWILSLDVLSLSLYICIYIINILNYAYIIYWSTEVSQHESTVFWNFLQGISMWKYVALECLPCFLGGNRKVLAVCLTFSYWTCFGQGISLSRQTQSTQSILDKEIYEKSNQIKLHDWIYGFIIKFNLNHICSDSFNEFRNELLLEIYNFIVFLHTYYKHVDLN